MANPGDNALTKTDNDGNKAGIDAATQNALRTEYMLHQQVREQERSNPNIVDLTLEFGHSALYSGIQAPVIGAAQLVDRGLDTKLARTLDVLPAPEEDKFMSPRWYAQTLGGGTGMALPFMLTKGSLKATGLSLATKTEATMVASTRLFSLTNVAVIGDGAISGFAYDFLLTPVQKNEGDFWKARRDHGLTGAGTFGALTASSVVLGHFTRPLAKELTGVKRIAYDFTSGTASGIPAGLVNADVNALLTKNRWATGEERGKGVFTMAMAGGVLSTFHKIPGQDLSPGEKALKASESKTGVANLEAMLAERARAAKTAITPGVLPEASTMTGAAKGSGSEASRMVAGEKIRSGREMASADVEGTEVKTDVPKAQEGILQKSVDLAFKASEPGASPEDMVAWLKYARSEGAPVIDALLKIANAENDPKLLAVVREAYLPLEGIEHRVIEGAPTIEPEPGKPPTADMLERWKQFTDLVEKEPPSDPEGYAKQRSDLFAWLDKNPDLHNWVEQLAKQNSWSNLAGPLDFYFGTNEMARFMDSVKPRVEKPITILDVQQMRQRAKEFADKALTTPYDENLIQDFRAMAEQSTHLDVPHFAKLINEALVEKGMGHLRVTVDSLYEMTLHKPKEFVYRESMGKVDYASVETPEVKKAPDVEKTNKVANKFGQELLAAKEKAQAQFIFSDASLALKQLGVTVDKVPGELNHVLTHNRMPYEVVLGADGKLELVFVQKKDGYQPLISVFNDANGKAVIKTGDQIKSSAQPKKPPEQAKPKGGEPDVTETVKLADDFAVDISKARNFQEAQLIFTNAVLELKTSGASMADVNTEMNHVLSENKMPWQINARIDGRLELVYLEQSGSHKPVAVVQYVRVK